MSIPVEHRKDVNELVIRMPPNFDFKVHRDFRSAYTSDCSPTTSYVVDFRNTNYLDSSALGMLLQLREHAGSDRKRLRLVNVNSTIMDILRIANFEKLMTIN